MGISPATINTYYYSPIQTRLDESRTLSLQLIPELQTEVQLNSLLHEVILAAEAVNNYMTTMSLGELCTQCSARASGGCCSRLMTGETDTIQLCMNMMAGIDVIMVNSSQHECLFLGEKGCIFLVKPMFCLNYLCSHIKNSSNEMQLQTLARLTGKQLNAQYTLEQYILTAYSPMAQATAAG